MDIRTTSTGFIEQVDEAPDKIPDFDPRSGNHFWVISGAWKCDPAALNNGQQALLDHENLVIISPPGCYYCERAYNPLLSMRKCKGQP